MADVQNLEQDPALQALSQLSEVAASSIEDLNQVHEQLVDAQRRRRRGWSWQRIISSVDAPNPLSRISTIAANLGLASGQFRRSLARALRNEGTRVNEIGKLMDVSRQRVSALLRPDRAE